MFSIDFIEGAQSESAEPQMSRKGLIVVGDFSEHFWASIGTWGETDYRRQWREGLERLAGGESASVLITAMADPDTGQTTIGSWPMWLFGDEVRIHHVVLLPELALHFDPAFPFARLDEYEPPAPGDLAVSEWRVPLASITSFLEARRDW